MYKYKFFLVVVVVVVVALGLVACNKNEVAEKNSQIVRKISANEINAGVLHNQDLDILLEAITPLYLNQDSHFSNYMQVFADGSRKIVAPYDCENHLFYELSEFYKFQYAEDIDVYMENIKKDFILNGSIAGQAYDEITKGLNLLAENSDFCLGSNENQIENVSALCKKIGDNYSTKCEIELDKFALKALTEICLYSFMYWSNSENMQKWETSTQYAKAKKKDDKKKGTTKTVKVVSAAVSADMAGARVASTSGLGNPYIVAGVAAAFSAAGAYNEYSK
jgi:hypothetical protein